MSFFDQILSGLFPGKKSQEPFLHELLTRSNGFTASYNNWYKKEKDFILGKIWKGYGFKRAKLGSSELTIHLLSSTNSNGFAVIFDPLLSSKNEFQFLMEYFKNSILDAEYKLVNADRRMIEKEQFIESIERYYLKPSPITRVEPIQQHYGNIIIEHVLNNDNSSHLKVVVNTYSDRNYQSPLPHYELFERLLAC